MSNRNIFKVISGGGDSSKNFKMKILDHRFTVAVRITGCILAVLLVIVILASHYNSQVYTKINTVNHIERKSSSTNSYLNNIGSVIIYSEDGVSCINEKGTALWNMTFEMKNPILKKSAGYVAVADNGGHIVYVVDSSSKVYEIDTKMPVRDVSISEKGLIAAVVEDKNNSWVYVYDLSGNLLVEVKATMTKTGYPMDVSLSGEVMAVSYLYVDSDNMKSSVIFYNFGGIGATMTDRIVSAYEYADSVVPVVEFLDSENIFAVGDNRMMFYTGSKKPVDVADIILSEKIVGVYYGENKVGLVFYDDSGEHKYKLALYNKNGTKIMEYRYDIDYKDILISGSQVLIYNESDCIIVSDEGKEKYNGNFEKPVQYVASTQSAKKYILVTEESLDMVRFE